MVNALWHLCALFHHRPHVAGFCSTVLGGRYPVVRCGVR